MFGWDDAIGIGASLLGGMMGDDAASDAAQTQAAATDRANERLERQYQQTRSDLTPYRNLGTGAVNALATYLGLGGGSGGGMAVDRNAIRARLLPQFTSGGGSSGVPAHLAGLPPDVLAGLGYGQWSNGPGVAQGGAFSQGGPAAGTVDEAALNAAIEQEIASMSAGQGNAKDRNFGYLLRNFSLADFQADPSYEFRKAEGMKGIENSAAARGGLLSGATLKGLNRFNSDLASQEYGNAFNRDSANKQRIFGMLSGTAASGQNAAAMTGTAGMNVAGQVSNNTTGLGNAQGAAAIAGGNAWNNAFQNAVGGYQRNQYLNELQSQNSLLSRITGGNTGWGAGEPWRTSGSGMPDWYQLS